jgi:hypothetical protein
MHFIKYQEQDLPIAIDFAVIKNTCAKLQIGLSQFEQIINNPDQTQVVFFEALKRGAKIEGKAVDYTPEQVEDILSADCVYGSFLAAFSEDVLKMFISDKKK